MARRKTNDFWGYLKKNAWYIVAIIWLLPLLYQLILRVRTKATQAENQQEIDYLETIQNDPNKQDDYMSEVPTDVKNDARQIYHHLGLAYDWYDPRSWSENDEEVYLILAKYNGITTELSTAYYVVSAGRNLEYDILKYLDKKYLKLL